MRLATLILSGVLAGSALTLSACGYQLRGTQVHSSKLPVAHTQAQIISEDNPLGHAVRQKLIDRLTLMGVDGDDGNASNKIQIKNLRYRRYELVGVLTEVRLLLMADVHYQIMQNGQMVDIVKPVQVEKSYQFNEADVATSDQQGEQNQRWLQDSLTERIAEQYYSLGITQ